MGRREHLELTLPYMLEEFERVIVVDYSCPQQSGKWAESQGAKVVYVKNEDYWNASKARNRGARACESRSICFIDADVIAMPNCRVAIERALNLSTMVIASRDFQNVDISGLNGFIALDIGQFWGVKGYDESLEGYGLEDAHLRARLLFERGMLPKRLAPDCLASVRHSNGLRQRFAKDPIELSSKRNHASLMQYLASHGVRDWINSPLTADIAYRQ
jgi:predicted glycosyltransferase involved in capsule biosynthesis